MNVILFGEMGAGKGAVAKILQKHYHYEVFSLGEKIHRECRLHGLETREEMQLYGQAMRKIFGEDTWNKYLWERINTGFRVQFEMGFLCIDDGRQPNEMTFWEQKGFLTVGVYADKEIRLERLKKRINYSYNPETEFHETEINARNMVKRCKLLLDNSGTVDDLKRQVELHIIRG